MQATLSERTGNPANGLRKVYDELMAYTDLDEMKARVMDVIGSYAGRGIGQARLRDAGHAVAGCMTLVMLQRYVTNFILAADGLRVVVLGR